MHYRVNYRLKDADSPGVTDSSGSNNGLFERAKWISTSKTMDLRGPLCHDLFDMDCYLLNQVDINVRNPASFALLAAVSA